MNQAMTDYLNSFLQTLYMTPEFRNAVYRYLPAYIYKSIHIVRLIMLIRWKFKGSEEEGAKSIPYQLQRLFLHLQVQSG